MDEETLQKIKEIDSNPIESFNIKQYINRISPKKTTNMSISQIDVESLGDNVIIEGILQASSQIISYVEQVKWVCQKCHEIYSKRTFKCETCRGKNVSEETIRYNLIKARIIEEKKELQNNSNVFSIEVWITRDLAKYAIDKLFIGEVYQIEGKVCSLKRAKVKSEEEFYIEATTIIPKKTGIRNVPLSEEMIEKVKYLSKEPDRNIKMIKSIFGNIVSQETVLEAILLQMVSSPKGYEKGTLNNRGKLMILLTGSPGCSKSQILQRTVNFYPRSMFVSGKSTTGIGLVAKVDKDESLGTWVAYPGAIPLCSPDGICAIDEVNLIPDEMEHLNDMMMSLKISISKSSVHVIIPADTSLLCAMNPEDIIFIEDKSYITQLGLPQTFIDRLDLIFNLDYFEKPGHSDKVLKSMAGLNDDNEIVSGESPVERDLVLAYIVMANRINPTVSISARNQLIQEYESIASKRDSKSEDYYSYRLFMNLWRLASAYARIRLSDYVDFVDIKDAKEMLLESLKSMKRVKVVSGQLKIDEEDMSGVKPMSKLKQKDAVFALIESQKEPISEDEMLSHLAMTRTEMEEALEYLKGKGRIFEPKSSRWKAL